MKGDLSRSENNINLFFYKFQKRSFTRLNRNARLTLDRYNHEDCGDANETGIADLQIKNISHDQGRKRCRPHVMNKDGDEIESIDIVGH